MADPAAPIPDSLEVVTPVVADAASPAPQSETPTSPQGGDPVVTPPVAEASAPATGELPKVEPSLLEKFDADKAKPAEPEKPVVEAKPDAPTEAAPEPEKTDPTKVEEPPAETEKPVLEAVDYFAAETGVKLPETLKLDDATRTEATAAFDLLRTDPAKGAQALVNLHDTTMQKYAEHLGAEQWRIFNDTQKGWQTEVMADPVLGGAGYHTAMGKVAQARDAFVSSAQPGTPKYQEDLAAWDSFCKVTGAGNHPAFLRFLHNASKYVREAAVPPPDPKPPKDIGKAPGRKGLGSIYTHPTSNPE